MESVAEDTSITIAEQASSTGDPSTEARPKPTQFSIFHLLVWTTAIAPLFAMARFIDIALLRSLSELLQGLSLGVSLAILTLVAIWCGLGREGLFVRCLLTITASVAIGGIVGLASRMNWFDRMRISWQLTRSNMHFEFWITWMCLVTCFLAGMLMFFRARDQRLIKTRPELQWVRKLKENLFPMRRSAIETVAKQSPAPENQS